MTFILHWIANNLIPDATIRQAFSDLFIPMYIGIVINFQKGITETTYFWCYFTKF